MVVRGGEEVEMHCDPEYILHVKSVLIQRHFVWTFPLIKKETNDPKVRYLIICIYTIRSNLELVSL